MPNNSIKKKRLFLSQKQWYNLYDLTVFCSFPRIPLWRYPFFSFLWFSSCSSESPLSSVINDFQILVISSLIQCRVQVAVHSSSVTPYTLWLISWSKNIRIKPGGGLARVKIIMPTGKSWFLIFLVLTSLILRKNTAKKLNKHLEFILVN